MSFNAKEALERIRQSKASASKADSQSVREISNNNPIHEDVSEFQSHRKQPFLIEHSNHFDELNNSGFGSIHSIQNDNTAIMNELMRKVEHLEKTTERLSRELAHSQQITVMMRKEKSTLQNQILKLEGENKNLKLEQKKKQTKQNEKSNEKINYHSKQESTQKISKEQEYSIVSDPINDSIQMIAKYGIVSQQFLQPVINEPLGKILQKKEKNFRALKVNSRLQTNECKQLLELARVFKEYPTMQRPTIEIDISNLNQQNFDQ